MKKHLSVFYLIARESIFRIFFVCILSAAVQTGMFILQAEKLPQISENPSLSLVFSLSYIRYIFFAFLIAVFILLIKTGMQFNSKIGYTLRRLRVSENRVFLWQSVYNFTVLLLVILSEVVLCFVLALAGSRILPEEYITGQSIYIAFYDNSFLMHLFAGRDIIRIIRNITALVSFAVNFAAFSFLFRRGRKWAGAVITAAAGFFLYVKNDNFELLGNDIAFLVFFAASAFISAVFVLTRGEQYD